MTVRADVKRIGIALSIALILPPALTYSLSSLMPQTGVDIFSVLAIEALAFVVSAAILKAELARAVLAALLYFPSMFMLIFWIGYRAGFYDLP